MSLGDHLRELRRRVLIAATAILLGAILGWWKYQPIFDQISKPIYDVARQRGASIATLNFANPTDSFSIAITVGLFVGLVVSSPVWLFQIWGFILPGLTKRERRTSLVFIGAAVPLFLGGCALAFATLP